MSPEGAIPVVENKYVAFCDILGFSNRVSEDFDETLTHTYWDSNPLIDPVADALPHGGHARPQAGQAIQRQERLVDRIHLDPRAVLSENFHYAITHIRVERVI